MAATDNRTAVQSNLHQQDLSKLDVTKLTAVSPEVISRQATINIGTIGHVAHGKSTVVKAISGVQTVRFKNELERNITIKLERLPEAVIESYKAADPVKKRKGSSRSGRAVKKRKTGKQKVDEYIVEGITGQMVIHGEQVFCVKWKGWPDDRNTWEPIENLNNCDKIIHQFITLQAELHSTQLEALKTELSFDRLLDASALESLWVLGRDRPQAVRENTLDLLALLNLSLAEEEWATALVLKARNSLREAKLAEMRASQLKALKDWETSVNITDKMGKIRVENTADLEGPPENFRYINENEPAEGVIIPDDPIMGCQCVSCHSKSNCDCAKLGGLFAYSSNKRLRVSIGTPIYECNRHCLCSSDCSNRVTQRGRMAKLCIFRTSTGCGWGVRAEQRIKEGQFVCEYVGEVMLSDEAERRSSTYDTWRSTYLFDLDFNPNVEATYTIDASQIGNISHFINHSCDPNLAVFAVWVNCLDPNMPHLCLFASRDIEPGEEISFDYLQKTGDNCGQTEGKEDSAIEDAKTPLKTSKCRCMSIKCRQFLFKMM